MSEGQAYPGAQTHPVDVHFGPIREHPGSPQDGRVDSGHPVQETTPLEQEGYGTRGSVQQDSSSL